jgi:tetratricopeptide (TPR) repeat protein
MMSKSIETARSAGKPYVMSLLDRWIILVIVVGASLFLCKPLYGYSIYFRGVNFEESFQFAAASQYYEKATDEYAQVPEAWDARAELHLMRGRVDPNEYRYAIDVFRRGLVANPSSAKLSFDLCRGYYEIGRDYRDALSACRSTIARDPANAFAWDLAAWSSAALGDTGQAVRYWKRAVDLKPSYTAAKDAIALYEKCAC